MNETTKKRAIAKAERTLCLSECSGILATVAAAMVKAHGIYFAVVDGQRVAIVADASEAAR
jgi:hypothetical protein